MAASQNPRAAVVVGIDAYADPAITDLAGAVSDARAMASLLVDHFNFPASAVTLLLGAQATFDAVDGALAALAERVAPGGVAFFFFAGHGSQCVDASLDEADGWDETLVPVDSGRDGRPRRDLSDDRVRSHLDRLVERGATAVVCLDCCHSGTGGRSGAGVRAAPPIERSHRGVASDGSGGGGSGGMGLRGPGLRARAGEPRYTLIAAAGADERAFERPPAPGLAPRGLLTHALVDVLRGASPDDSWRTVMRSVAARVSGVEPRQHPQLEGAGRDRRVFESDDALPWVAAESSPDGVRVALGWLHGVAPGDRIALCPLDSEAPRWRATVVTVGVVACRCGPAPAAELAGSADAPRLLRARQMEAGGGRGAGLWDLELAPDDSGLSVSFDADALLDDEGRSQVSDGESFTLRVATEGGKRLYMGLVSLDERDRPTVLLPEPGVEWALAPFGSHRETFEAILPPGAQRARHRLVLVVTDRPVDLRPLEADTRSLAVPALDDVRCTLRRIEIYITSRQPEMDR